LALLGKSGALSASVGVGRPIVIYCAKEIIITYVLPFIVSRSKAHHELHQLSWLHSLDRLEYHVDEFLFADSTSSSHILPFETIVKVRLTGHDFGIDIFDGGEELRALEENFISPGQSKGSSGLFPVTLSSGWELRALVLVAHDGSPEPMLSFAKYILVRFIFGKIDCPASLLLIVYPPVCIIRTPGIHGLVAEILATKGANELISAQLRRIAVDQSGPLIHFVPRFLVEFFLVEVIFLLEFLGQFPDHVIFEFEKFTLLFVVLEEHLAFGQLSGQVVRVDVHVDFELLGYCIFDILVQLPIPVQEADIVGSLSLTRKLGRLLRAGRVGLLLLLFSVLLLGRDLLHKHEDLVDSCDVLLHFGDIVLEHGRLHAFS